MTTLAFDMPLAELERYCPERLEPPDFDAFWNGTLDESRRARRPATFEPFDAGLTAMRVYDVTFSGFAGQPIKAWLILPAHGTPMGCVVQYIGYSDGRGHATDRLLWAAAGYATFVVDNRGQLGADTPDEDGGRAAPQAPGLVTKGIDDRRTYYYRRLIADAVLALDAALDWPEVDPERIGLVGMSQGGGLALAVAGLDPRPRALVCDVPFLSHYRRALEITEALPYAEISEYLARRRVAPATVFDVLASFDGLNFAVRARAEAFFSVGLADDVCPPSTVFAAYNHYAGKKQLQVYPYNQHEGGEAFHDRPRLDFLAATIGS